MSLIGAIDMGGTKIAVGLVSLQGEVLAGEQFPTQTHPYPAGGLQEIVTRLDRLLLQAGQPLAGIGIACTGQVNPATFSLGHNAFLPGWDGAQMVTRLQQHYHVPVALQNDAVAAALAESAWGAGKGLETLLYITVSTGIGGGLVQHGRAYIGIGGAHPEIGHHTIDPSGPACYCGAHGCWESLASGTAMAAWASSQGSEPSQASLLAGKPVTAERICAAAVDGDPLALAAVRHEGYYLGLGMANLIDLFAPDAIILGGGVMKSLPLFRAQIDQVIKENCRLVPYEKVQLLPASLGSSLALAGAAQVWLSQGDLA